MDSADTAEGAVDEKKPLNSLEDVNEEETQPDPDEILKLDGGLGRIWLIKVSFVTYRWIFVRFFTCLLFIFFGDSSRNL